MQELFYGSIAERELLSDAITNKGVETYITDSLTQMATNVDNIVVGHTFTDKTQIYSQTYNDQNISYTYTNATGTTGLYMALAGGRTVSTSSSGTILYSSTISRASTCLALLENGQTITSSAAWDNGQIVIFKVG